MSVTTVSTAGLSAAIRERLKYPGRSEAQIANTAAYYIAGNAKNFMPFVGATKVNTELGVTVSPIVKKDGTLSKRNRKSYGKGVSRSGVPITALIVAARANPASRYNVGDGDYKGTNSRYALAVNPFKGVSRAAGAAAMRLLVRKMVSARRKSGHFLQSGWIGAIKALKPLAVVSRRVSDAAPLDGAKFDYNDEERGQAIPAVAGSWRVSAEIANSTGLQGVNAANFNAALHLYGEPALQAAIDKEEKGIMEYAEAHYKPLNDKFTAMCK